MNDFDQYLNLSPLHRKDLNDRLFQIKDLKEHLQVTEKLFTQYSQIGTSLTQVMRELAKSFQAFKEFNNDPSLKSIIELLNQNSDTLSQHFTTVPSHIIEPLHQFVAVDISKCIEAGRNSESSYNNYVSASEKYVAFTKKKASVPGASEECESRLKEAHKQAAIADFNLSRSCELVDCKKLIEVSASFLAFITTMNTTYRECAMNFEEFNNNFRELQQAFPEVTSGIKKFNQNTDIKRNSLEHCIELYARRMNVKFETTPALDHEGFLWKKGSGITKSWQRRYFICNRHELAYYHNAADSATPSGRLPLMLTSVKPLHDPERRNCFTVISQDKVYTLQALTEWDMNEWIGVIANNIQYLLDNADKNETESGTGSSIPRPLELECNKHCADCGASFPTWTCINWGNSICIQCSGVHRSLTTTVSKVRSLTLDRLENLILELINALGNTKVNEILEGGIQPGQKITASATKEQREQFITQKYKDKAFLVNRPPVDMKAAIMARNLPDVFLGVCQNQVDNESGFTYLHLAASVGDPLITLLIALNTVKINELDNGWSPLSYAAYYGNVEACEALLCAGLDPNATAPDAHPYLVAHNRHNIGIETLLTPYWKGDRQLNVPGGVTPPTPLSNSSEQSAPKKTQFGLNCRNNTLQLIAAYEKN